MVCAVPSTVALAVFTTGAGVGVGAGVEAAEPDDPPHAAASTMAVTADGMNDKPLSIIVLLSLEGRSHGDLSIRRDIPTRVTPPRPPRDHISVARSGPQSGHDLAGTVGEGRVRAAGPAPRDGGRVVHGPDADR